MLFEIVIFRKMVLVSRLIRPYIRDNLGKSELVLDLSYLKKGIEHLAIEKIPKNVISGSYLPFNYLTGPIIGHFALAQTGCIQRFFE